MIRQSLSVLLSAVMCAGSSLAQQSSPQAPIYPNAAPTPSWWHGDEQSPQPQNTTPHITEQQITRLIDGYKRGSMLAAYKLGGIAEQLGDYALASQWYHAAYRGNYNAASRKIVDFILTGKTVSQDPYEDKELLQQAARAGVPSAAAYVSQHYGPQQGRSIYPPTQTQSVSSPQGNYPPQRTYSQPSQPITTCSRTTDPCFNTPEGRKAWLAENQRSYEQLESARHDRGEPSIYDSAETIANRNSQKAREGALLLLLGAAIIAISRPATGPGSAACDHYHAGVIGSNASDCFDSGK